MRRLVCTPSQRHTCDALRRMCTAMRRAAGDAAHCGEGQPWYWQAPPLKRPHCRAKAAQGASVPPYVVSALSSSVAATMAARKNW
jgi:hypothetical protein